MTNKKTVIISATAVALLAGAITSAIVFWPRTKTEEPVEETAEVVTKPDYKEEEVYKPEEDKRPALTNVKAHHGLRDESLLIEEVRPFTHMEDIPEVQSLLSIPSVGTELGNEILTYAHKYIEDKRMDWDEDGILNQEILDPNGQFIITWVRFADSYGHMRRYKFIGAWTKENSDDDYTILVYEEDIE